VNKQEFTSKMSENISVYFDSKLLSSENSEETKACGAVLFNDTDIRMGDKQLNQLAVMTYNSRQCDNLFNLLEEAIEAELNPAKTIYKALLVIHTILLYGSEYAVDKCIALGSMISILQNYNEDNLLLKSIDSNDEENESERNLSSIRSLSMTLSSVLIKDTTIREVREIARINSKDSSPLPPPNSGTKENQPHRYSDKYQVKYEMFNYLHLLIISNYFIQTIS
jgi:hypothetical protein